MAKTPTTASILKNIKAIINEHPEKMCLTICMDRVIDFNEEVWDNPSKYENMFLGVREQLKKMKGVYDVAFCQDHFESSLTIIRKPCKEFEQLQKWLATHNVKLGVQDVRVDYVEGKRSSYYVYGHRYLCHNADACKRTLAYLKENVKSTHKLIVSKATKPYWGDRFNSYGEDMECEWSGHMAYVFDLVAKTPSGRTAAETTIRA